ncbi:unnamed protein product [Cladocopium goreaui]|uniref:Uncharacterized protein n=1 Tax=Cladocopium goreaui TaxID=2562237 RepID=A0A9P1FXZ4_9DINO|nr:unnamed protein product [Cladocopium goreaui]
MCQADCLQQYRLKQGCPMHDCPFCLQNEDSQEEADDGGLQEMETEAAMEAEAVAEGVKRKTREEAASPVRAGGGPAGKKLTTNASPPAGQRSPVPPTQRSPSPESPPFTQGGSEAARLSIPSFGIDIYDLSQTSKASTTVKDPMHDAISNYLACMDEAQRNAVASDFAFRTREVLPAPFGVSLRTIARKEGTRLRLQPDEEHQRGCVVQIVCAGDPSMRKSSLKDFTSKKLLTHADVPAVIKAGLHYGNKEKMCTWLNCEGDKTVTGDGATALTHYIFVHHVYGQVSLCEYVLQPTASMFSKRIHATWQTRPVTSDPDQQSQSSKEFLIDFFGWMGRMASNQDKDHYFDKFALPVLRKALQGPKAVPDVKTPGLADLDAKMKLQQVILSNPRCAGPTSTAHIRSVLKYHFQKEKEEKPAKYVLAAVKDLLKVGILQEVDKKEVEEQAPKLKDKKSAKSKEATLKSEPRGPPRGPPGGHAVLYYQTCAWEDLLTNSEAQDMIAKLQLSANDFK